KLLLHKLFLIIMLTLYFPKKLFNNIFHSNNTCCTAIFIKHYRHTFPFAGKYIQKLFYKDSTRHMLYSYHYILNIFWLLKKLKRMHITNKIIQRTVIHHHF